MNENFISDYILDIKGKLYLNFKHEYAYNEIEKFLKAQTIDFENFEIIEPQYHISYQDFSITRDNLMRDIYLGLLGSIKKENGELIFNKKVCLSFDERLCTRYCEATKRKFTTMNVGGADIVYFVYFDIKEVFDYIYSKKADTKNSTLEVQQEIKSIKLVDKPPSIEIKKIKGVVVNHNFERGEKNLTFVLTSSDEDGLVLHHTNFSEISKLDIGTILEVKYVSRHERKYAEDYEVLNEQEIPELCEFFEGELFLPRNSSIAFIHHSKELTIFVPPHLLDDFQRTSAYSNVRCLAIKRNKDEEYKLEWEAIRILKI